MIVNSGHLKDEQIFECYVADRSGEPIDPRAADHLSDCQECVGRYDDLLAFMDTLREAAEVDTDERFPAERLVAQQQEILRRLEQVHRSARVITFPGRDALNGARGNARVAPRWLAAAAAAGLFVGVAVGGYLGPGHLGRASARQTAQIAQVAPAMTVQAQLPQAGPAIRVGSTGSDTTDDDTFLVELEVALARPHTRELQPFDALTPHVRDIDVRTR